ncbi:MAG: Asp-tRNA(Asn)/Glu-tRNA(Gln) amidotransferase subunit GatA [Saprospiraceae bacterium]
MQYTTLSTIQAAISTGNITHRMLVEQYLQKIEDKRALNIYIEVFKAEALDKADELDQKMSNDPAKLGKLAGLVISIKDVICYEGHQVTAASKILEGFTSLFTATALQRLIDEDVIIIGRVNCDQFAMGSTNENSVYGPTRNAANPEKVPGGSSGASAVSVQAHTCLASLGSDTGGSVRQPAAFCGVIGFKPTYGRISRHGLLAYGSSFDQIGTLTHSVEDAALLLELMAGADEYDSTVSSSPVPKYSHFDTTKTTYKIATFGNAIDHEGIDPEIKSQTMGLIHDLRQKGHQVDLLDFELLDFLIPAYYVLTTAEASSNLSRYDGIRFGHRSKDATNLYETYTKSRSEGFSTEVKRRIMLGTFVLSAGYYDAYYSKAQKVRRLLAEKTAEIFSSYDFILLPASPTPPWNIGESLQDPVAMYLADIFTVYANMAGIPAIALPLGTDSNGLPIGVQFMADKFKEADLLNFAKMMC